MNKEVLALLPMLLLLVLYLLIFKRKGEIERLKASTKSNDWVTFMAAIFGSGVLASSMSAIGIWQKIQTIWMGGLFAIVAGILFIVVWRARNGRPIIQLLGDERMTAVNAKSSRNALFATYLALWIHLLLTDAPTLDANWLFIVLAGGLSVLIASTFFYYYRKA